MTYCSTSSDAIPLLLLTLSLEQVKFVQPNLAVVQGRVFFVEQEPETSSTSCYLAAKELCHVFVRKESDVCKLRRALFVGNDSETPKQNDNKTGRWLELSGNHQEMRRMLFRTTLSKTIERNRRGVKLLECDEFIQLLEAGFTEEKAETNEIKEHGEKVAPPPLTTQFQLHDKSCRHALFAQWLVAQYGADFLSQGAGVLDVAGGKAELSGALLEAGVSSVVMLDPEPRVLQENDDSTKKIHVMAHALEGDGSSLLRKVSVGEQEILRNCSMIVGMHPDQATESIIDFAQKLNVPFAMLPCCVMPSLFPRRVHQGQPVRSYRTFCQFLQHKHDGIQVDYLPFMGRNMILYDHNSTHK